jgi:hypothetical protein
MLTRLLAAAAAALAVIAAAGAAGPAAARVPAPATIATVTTVDYRVVVTAVRTSGGAAPTAAVTLTTFTKEGAGWHRASAHRISGTYFWKTVTAPHAICRFAVNTGAAGAAHASIQLLQTPSLGCAREQTVLLPMAN